MDRGRRESAQIQYFSNVEVMRWSLYLSVHTFGTQKVSLSLFFETHLSFFGSPLAITDSKHFLRGNMERAHQSVKYSNELNYVNMFMYYECTIIWFFSYSFVCTSFSFHFSSSDTFFLIHYNPLDVCLLLLLLQSCFFCARFNFGLLLLQQQFWMD